MTSRYGFHIYDALIIAAALEAGYRPHRDSPGFLSHEPSSGARLNIA